MKNENAGNAVSDYGWRSACPEHSHGYIAARVVSTVKDLVGTTARILDLGSGNGALCGTLAAAGHEVVGGEYDEEGVRIASSAYPHIPFHRLGVQDDPSELLRREKPFDVVVSTEVVEHLFSPHLLPIYARAVLNSGGHLLLTAPYHGYLKNLALAASGKLDAHFTVLWHGGHIKFWSRRSLTLLLESSGFSVIGFRGLGRVPYLWKSMLLVARRTAG